MKKSILLFVASLLFPLMANAYDVEINGIYYNLVPKAKVAEVTSGENKYTGDIIIPDNIVYEDVKYTVTTIRGGFSNTSITSIDIPPSLSIIKGDAFHICYQLNKVIIHDLSAWCKIEFEDGYDFETNPLQYAHHLYLNDTEITELVIPDNIEKINNSAFSGCTGLTSVTIPNSVTSIGDRAFLNCSALPFIIIPNTVRSIGNHAFCNCVSLTSVTIPNSVESLGNNVFSGCIGLTSVTIPNSVTSIGNSAFSSCTGLVTVTIPNSVTNIGDWAFSGCTGLTSINIPILVTEIHNYTFYGCTGLTSVTIPNSVTRIGWASFYGCSSLTSVIISNSVTFIDSWAFAFCSKMEEVCCKAEVVPETATNAFQDSYNAYTTLIVPENSIKDYKTTAPWSEFGTFKSVESGTEPEIKKCATPFISYSDKKLTFTCETEGVEYVSSVKVADNNNYYDSEINLTATYEISVYATKSDYENSDIATATLVWTEATFTETTPDTPTSAKAVTENIPVLISANNGNITVRSEANGQSVAVYSVEGQLLGIATVSNGQATISTTLQNGNVAVVKVGNKSVKILMK